MKALFISLVSLLAITSFAAEKHHTPINLGVESIETDFVSTKNSYDTLIYRNNCYKPIWAAIHFLNLSGNWETAGWFRIEPGQAGIVAETQNTIYYIYAESTDGDFSWSGDNYISVRNDGSFGFIRKEITTNDWGDWTQTFTCNN